MAILHLLKDAQMLLLQFQMPKLGFPSRTTIYFCVDFDALETDIKNSILPYFEAVFKLFSDTGRNPKNYKVGVYGIKEMYNVYR